jgi:hypothetical protein
MRGKPVRGDVTGPLIIVDRGYGGYMHRIGLEII